jgi:hypothetical protein
LDKGNVTRSAAWAKTIWKGTTLRKASARAACLAAGAISIGFAGFAPSASASAIHPDPSGHAVDLGPSPTGVGNCSFPNNDASFLTVSGNAVKHETSNKNGDWGGITFEGTAIFQEAPYSGFDSNGNPIDTGSPVQLYEGHLSYWNGGGNNAGGQSEGGFTADFHGTALFGSGTLDIHVNVHGTTNNSGTPTANVTNVSVACS